MDEKEALRYAANILRTMAAQDPENSVHALRAARMLDGYFMEEDDGPGELQDHDHRP